MDIILFLKAAILGIVEGATEFLPVSSTGHLILASHALGFDAQGNVLEIVIQTGAILAVILLYFQKLWATLIGLPTKPEARRFAFAVAISFLPAAFLGLLLHDYIKTYLFSTTVVSISLIVGGIIMLLVEQKKPATHMNEVDDITLPVALRIGLFQCIAMIPGVSRSGATIVGARLLGVGQKAAAEFSFYLAIPTIVGAALLDLYKSADQLAADDWQLIGVGFIAAFISAVVVIKAFISWLSRHGLGVFAWYRIVAGVALLAYFSVAG